MCIRDSLMGPLDFTLSLGVPAAAPAFLGASLEWAKGAMWERLMAVSYTHLDVYKRQE